MVNGVRSMPDNYLYVEPTDSSATIMRGVAAALNDEWMVPQSWSRLLVALTKPANHLPEKARIRLVDFFVRNLGVSQSLAGEVKTEGLAQWAVNLYGAAPPSYETIVLGAPSGGIGHLAALLRAPFLSEHFVTRYRYRGDPDDVGSYLACGATLGETVLQNNADLQVVTHYDPIHDRFMVPHVNYLRMKLLTLPGPYQRFIERRLLPGGTILFADCRSTWRQYRVSRRHSFQVGGLGGVTDSEYVQGSPEVAQYLAEKKARRHTNAASQGPDAAPGPTGSWSVPLPWLPQRESEWGSLQAFRRSVETFASEHGYRFLALNGSHPADFSRIAFYASRQALQALDREPSGVLVDCFTLTSPTGALRAGLLPLWLPYNCVDSLEFLNDMAPDFPPGKPVLLAPAPSFSPSWDVTQAAQWVDACGSQADITWLGINPAAYPVDVAGMFSFLPALQSWCAQAPARSRPSLTIADLEALMNAAPPTR
jgi:hypothetical protein